MKDISSCLVRIEPNGNRSLAHCLQGVQHFGYTVDDMSKAIEFYTEVLGGKLALKGDGFTGEVLHNTLFQKEDIEAIERGVDPKTLLVPNIRDGSQESLDVRFVSFGNTCVELIHFRDAKLDSSAPNWGPRMPSSVASTNAAHLSFHVRDDVDLNLFAKALEEECQRRGLTQVVCNRVIHVNSEAERRAVALKYNANKFWNDPDYFVEGYSDSEFGDFFGWSLFYCKGPNGEQLEFNQVTRKARTEFIRAQGEYNALAGTSYVWPSGVGGPPGPIEAQGVQTKPGRLTALVQEMFDVGAAMDVEKYVSFYTEDALYQFGNSPPVFGPRGIKQSSAALMDTVSRVEHRIKRVWEANDSVVCDMDVTYTRRDGKVVTLPCCDILGFRGDKICEARIFMDIAPVFASR
jgi:catechol 2,3-dioxygenase-like lactoylglutathione lyase family enzyme/ketosteroid isomerase-like protein